MTLKKQNNAEYRSMFDMFSAWQSSKAARLPKMSIMLGVIFTLKQKLILFLVRCIDKKTPASHKKRGFSAVFLSIFLKRNSMSGQKLPLTLAEHQTKTTNKLAKERSLIMDKTSCNSFFAICSNGIIENMVGFIANPNSDFDPDYITGKLGIEPCNTRKMGVPRKPGKGCYPFSDWSACNQTEPVLDVEEQCLNIVGVLKEKIPILFEIKEEFDVTFSIIIVPHIYNEESPGIVFNEEIIEFCYLTGTTIGVDLYVYDKE